MHLSVELRPDGVEDTAQDLRDAAGDGADINLMFDPELRDFYCEQAPHAFSPVPGGWGRMEATRCNLKMVDEATLLPALMAAHRLAGPKPKKPTRGKRRSS